MKLVKAMTLAAVLMGIMIVGTTGCTSSDNDSDSTNSDIAGEWVVDIVDDVDGVISPSLWSITQAGTTGTVVVSLGTSDQFTTPWALNLSGSSFSVYYVDVDPNPTFGYESILSITATVHDNNSISGTWVSTYTDVGQPTETSSGTITLTRATPPSVNIAGGWTFEFGTSEDFAVTMEQGAGNSTIYGSGTSTTTASTVDDIYGAIQDYEVFADTYLWDASTFTSTTIIMTGTVNSTGDYMSGTWVDRDNPASTGSWTATKP